MNGAKIPLTMFVLALLTWLAVVFMYSTANCQEIPRTQPQQNHPPQIMLPRTQWVTYQLDGYDDVPPQPRPIWEPIRRLRWWIRYRPGYSVPRYVPVEGGEQ